MKIYTKQGDEGKTSLIGGMFVSKDDLRVEAYGTLDELNSHIGLLLSMLKNLDEIGNFLQKQQANIFQISSLIASVHYNEAYELPADETAKVEEEIDNLTNRLPRKSAFIYPGGVLEAAQSHVCRTVCRRAERRIVALSHHTDVGRHTLRYMNRLSDYLFTLARYLNYIAGEDEKKWEITCK